MRYAANLYIVYSALINNSLTYITDFTYYIILINNVLSCLKFVLDLFSDFPVSNPFRSNQQFDYNGLPTNVKPILFEINGVSVNEIE